MQERAAVHAVYKTGSVRTPRQGERRAGALSPHPVRGSSLLLRRDRVLHLGNDRDAVRDEVRRVEAHAELADHGDVRARAQRLHERLGARARDGACRQWAGYRVQALGQAGAGQERICASAPIIRIISRPQGPCLRQMLLGDSRAFPVRTPLHAWQQTRHPRWPRPQRRARAQRGARSAHPGC